MGWLKSVEGRSRVKYIFRSGWPLAVTYGGVGLDVLGNSRKWVHDLWRPVTLLKTDSNTGVFLRILQKILRTRILENIYKHILYVLKTKIFFVSCNYLELLSASYFKIIYLGSFRNYVTQNFWALVIMEPTRTCVYQGVAVCECSKVLLSVIFEEALL